MAAPALAELLGASEAFGSMRMCLIVLHALHANRWLRCCLSDDPEDAGQRDFVMAVLRSC